MKKRFLSILLSLCMVLALLPVAAFAEDNEEPTETPVCTCEAVCAAEAMNADCPVCGAEGATIENCGKYETPVEETEPEQTAVEKVQALIDALPTVEELEAAEEATVNAAYEAAQAVYDALEALSPEDQEQITGVEKLMALMDWFNGQVEVLVEQPPVSYVDENGETQTCNDYTIVTSETSSWGENGKTTWYVVNEDVTLSTVEGDMGFYRAASASGNVNLILCDGVTLTAQAFKEGLDNNDVRGIRVNEGASLTIYGQTNGTGTLSAIGTEGSGILVKNSLTINGGIINATGTSRFHEVNGIEAQDGGHIIINGGIINATGKSAGIAAWSDGYIIINGGKVTAIAEMGAIWGTLTLPDSYKWRTAETDEFTTNTCMVSYTPDPYNRYVQIVVPGDERPYHNFDTDGKCECGKVKFTVTFNTNGGSVTPTTATTDISGKLTSLPTPERNGCRFTGWYTDKTGGTEVTETTIFTAHTTIYAHWNDYTAPTGEILLGKNSWNTFLNNISFGLFFKDTQEVTITATDNSGEDVKIEYLLSNKELTAEELATATFTVYNDKFTVEPNNEYVIYAKFSDNSGNVTYINSNGIVLDNVAPVISGIANGKTYCKVQTVTVSDKYDVTVTVNGTQITLDANGQFTLSPASGTQTVVATDKAGNVSAEMIVTVNDGHEGGTATCKDKAVCEYCGKPYGGLDGSTHAGGTEVRNAKDATCTEDGYTGDTYCLGCDTKLEAGEPIAKIGHDYEGKVTKEATTTRTGTKTYTCQNCGHSYEKELAKLPSQRPSETESAKSSSQSASPKTGSPKTGSPKTGDETPVGQLIAATTLSAVALAVLLLCNKKRKEN